jgi:hypothetical protein
MKTLATVAAAAALFAFMSPATAQDYQAPPAGAPPAAEAPSAAPLAPAMPDAMAPAPSANQDMAASSTSKFIEQQGDNHLLATNWIGSAVYNSADESLGNINDILFDENHQVIGVVVGVGGFLGIGQKNVAISIDSVDVSKDADGNLKFVVDTTADELNTAPPFTSLAQLKAQQPMPAAEPPAAPEGGNAAPEAPAPQN